MIDDQDFDADGAARAWDSGADAWDAFVESGADFYRTLLHAPALLEACGDVAGLRVIDVGCGQGLFSRQLAEAGARVTGVDVSNGQLGNAERHERDRPLGIAYHRLDAAALSDHWGSSSFHMATACMALQDMPDIARVLTAVRKVLTPEGRLVFSVPHPATNTGYREWERNVDGTKRSLKIDHYFASGPGLINWNMKRLTHHWSTPQRRQTLEEWWDFVTDAGFSVRALREPRPSAEVVAAEPRLEDSRRLPYFLIISARAND